MKNNRLTRSKKHKFTKLADGTEVLKSSGSRVKQRRWSFVAHVTLDGQPQPRVLALQSVSYNTAKGVARECLQQEQILRSSIPLFATAQLSVKAMPHETVSHITLNQLNGLRDMSHILDLALELALKASQDVVSGRSVGSDFAESDVVKLKEMFYERARRQISGQAPEDSSNGSSEELSGAVAPVIQTPSGSESPHGIILTDSL